MVEATPRIVLDTSALMDLFGQQCVDSHHQHWGDLVKEVHILRPLKPFLYSTHDIRREVSEHMVIGGELEQYMTFEEVSDGELATVQGFISNRRADFSLTALCLRFENQGAKTFLITKDRTFVSDLNRACSEAVVVPPTGFAEALTVLTPPSSPIKQLAHHVQDNTFANLSRGMRLVQQQQGEAAYRDWQEFLDSQTEAKYELIEALKATGVSL
jgi:hypothetical protein